MSRNISGRASRADGSMTSAPDPSSNTTSTADLARADELATGAVAGAQSTHLDPASLDSQRHSTGSPQTQLPSIRFVPHPDPRTNRLSLSFAPVSRTLPKVNSVIKVGRYSERDNIPNTAPNVPSDAPIGFKSKVVSRKHCEFWCTNGQWYIKDVRSSSGTFLNHIRLSQPNLESRPFPVNDGDVVQLGIDFRGGEEMIFRCVKIRVECNRGWQKSLNNFNMSTHKRLRKLAKSAPKNDGDNASTHSSECSICLMSIAPCQSLFVAPCSHVWHYKCIRPILTGSNWPQFLCPNCRAVADLEADIDDPDAYEEWTEFERSEVAHEGDGNTSIFEQHASPDGEIHQEDSADISPASFSEISAHGVIDEALSTMVGNVSLADMPGSRGARQSTERSATPHNATAQQMDPSQSRSTTDNIETSSTSHPIDIGRPSSSRRPSRSPRAVEEGGSAMIPVSPQQLASATDTLGEGPLTPRNDAGPFVLDGSAGRAPGRMVLSDLGEAPREG
ncbi:MAG: hypothetical protein M1819_000289 [Sarea resinae]|nr:MAG: hypothetical protein M1819_000289 [Sarea resinae]